MSESTALPTRVAFAGWREHTFFGYRVFGELLGVDSFWGVMSLAVGGPRLQPDELRIIEDTAIVSTEADPRIWPLKLARLVSSYGGVTAGACAGMLFTAGAMLGAPAIAGAARLLVSIREALGERADDPDAVREHVEGMLAAGQRLVGFGVPFRPVDERVLALTPRVEALGRDRLPYWRLLMQVAEVVARRKGLPLNIVGPIAAVCLDIGFSPAQIEALVTAVPLCAFTGNALEAAQQRSPLMQELPPDRVEDLSPARRQSPRALEAAAGVQPGRAG